MTDKVRWGVLSTANIGRARVIPAIHNSANGVVAAVASRNLAKAEAFAKETGIPRALGSYEELIRDPEIDAIYISLPNSLHSQWSIRCAEEGKPTLCEKPLASNAPEAQGMVDAFRQRSVLFAEAFMYRFHPQTQRVVEMLEADAVGEVKIIRATFSFPVRSEDNIRLNRSLAGGSLMDVGCYCVNLMRLVTGQKPEHVAAIAQWGPQTGVDETLGAVLQFPSGVIGHLESSLRLPSIHSYEVHGTRGRILADQGFVMDSLKESVIRHWRDDQYQEVTIAPANHYKLMVEDFADALMNNRPPRFLPQDAVSNMEVIDRLYASAPSA